MRPLRPLKRLDLARASGLVPAGIAVILWSLAPALAAAARAVPPLQLSAACLAVAGLVTWPVTRRSRPLAGTGFGLAPSAWVLTPTLMLGAVGLYFAALRRGPPAEVALVTYTWPVLFVVAAEVLATRRVRLPALAGCALAFGGAGLVLMPAGSGGAAPWVGYGCAFLSGTCWAGFALVARAQSAPLTPAMPRVFALAALAAAAGHGVYESTLWPFPEGLALWIVLIGAGPYGVAFLLWDAALQRGPSATVGTLAYAVPVLSAIFLVAFGMAAADWKLPVAAAAVAGGCGVTHLARNRPRGRAGPPSPHTT
jgi:drug/metabolite transporter (DMT)-like permease